MRLKDQPASERPRERLVAHGADALTNAELIAILLRTGLKGANAVEIGRQLLQKYGSLQGLAQASVPDLQTIKGIGRDKAVTLVAGFTLARKMAFELRNELPMLDTPDAIASLMRDKNRSYEVEHFQVILLNTRRRLIRTEEVSQGTLDTILVHPREVFKVAIAANAAAVVLVHNHPSGDPTPSEADIKVTRDLIRAGQLLKIEVLDHVILGRATQERPKDYVSLRELGYFYT
jgi:DNA repair protein RadC